MGQRWSEQPEAAHSSPEQHKQPKAAQGSLKQASAIQSNPEQLRAAQSQS